MTVNPDEVVAVGAATQAAIIKAEMKDVLLLDVTRLSLGVEALGAMMTKVLERNTTIHARRTKVFSTAEDNQSAVDIVVRGRVTDKRVSPTDHTPDEAVGSAEARMSGEVPSYGTPEAPLRPADVVVARQ